MWRTKGKKEREREREGRGRQREGEGRRERGGDEGETRRRVVWDGGTSRHAALVIDVLLTAAWSPSPRGAQFVEPSARE